jgi:hypothetical protein
VEDEFGDINPMISKEIILSLEWFKSILEGRENEWFFDHFPELLEAYMKKNKG